MSDIEGSDLVPPAPTVGVTPAPPVDSVAHPTGLEVMVEPVSRPVIPAAPAGPAAVSEPLTPAQQLELAERELARIAAQGAPVTPAAPAATDAELTAAAQAAWDAPAQLASRVSALEGNAVSVQAYNGLVNAFNVLADRVARLDEVAEDHAEHIDVLDAMHGLAEPAPGAAPLGQIPPATPIGAPPGTPDAAV